MEEKQNYTPNEVAQIFAAAFRVYKGTTTSEETKKYEGFVPINAQRAISDIVDAQRRFYNRALSQEQKDSMDGLSLRLRYAQNFKNFLRTYDMLVD